MDPRPAIGFERRRLIQVRKAFEAALADRSAQDAEQRTSFLLACAAYVLFSMDRLHHQDQMIHDLLRERIPEQDRKAHDQLLTLCQRQAESRALVEQFGVAADTLRRTGPTGLKAFETEARTFTDAFNGLMAPRKNPFQPYTDRLFTTEDWTLIAAVTDESQATEQNLYNAVQLSAPAGCEPDGMQVVFH